MKLARLLQMLTLVLGLWLLLALAAGLSGAPGLVAGCWACCSSPCCTCR